jgi:hypothetical protein
MPKKISSFFFKIEKLVEFLLEKNSKIYQNISVENLTNFFGKKIHWIGMKMRWLLNAIYTIDV